MSNYVVKSRTLYLKLSPSVSVYIAVVSTPSRRTDPDLREVLCQTMLLLTTFWVTRRLCKDATQMTPTFSQLGERLHNRRFAVTNNTHGLSGAGTVFHYLVEGDAISSTYKGGRIRLGMQVGRVTGVDTIELLFHCLTLDGELLSGWSRGTVGVDQTGRTILSFVWGWLSGAVGGGESSYVEVVENKRHA